MQRKIIILKFILPLILLTSHLSVGTNLVAAQQVNNKSAGKNLYLTLCASCHGKTRVGNGPVASQLKTKPKDLTLLKQKMGETFDKKVIKNRIDGRTMPRAHGIPEMPVWGEWFSIQSMSMGRLQEDQEGIMRDVEKNIDALAEYILTLQQ